MIHRPTLYTYLYSTFTIRTLCEVPVIHVLHRISSTYVDYLSTHTVQLVSILYTYVIRNEYLY
jgi:hypothetical protein